MFSVTKLFYFCAGHQLPGHKGKCKNVHGHNYKLEITVSAPLGKMDMVMDYGDLKDIVKPILEQIDHSFILTPKNPEWLAKGLKEDGMKTYHLNGYATTENILAHILLLVEQAIGRKFYTEYRVTGKLWESESSFAEVYLWD